MIFHSYVSLHHGDKGIQWDYDDIPTTVSSNMASWEIICKWNFIARKINYGEVAIAMFEKNMFHPMIYPLVN